MSSPTSRKQQIPAVTPNRVMRGHTGWVKGVVHLPGGRRIVTCSSDGSLRLWDLEGAQVGDDWQNEGDETNALYSIALSPNGKTIASGSSDGMVRLWDVEMGKVIAKWPGHIKTVRVVCWSADGERVLSGSKDGTARVWDADTGETLLDPIKTGHEDVWAVIYSPNKMKIATGGFNEGGVKIWDANTGELLSKVEDSAVWSVWSLTWTSDGNKLISASRGSIRIFNTTTWKQIAILDDHKHIVTAITLSQNNRLLVSTDDTTARLWNLDTNIQIGPPLQHEHVVVYVALSGDGKVLVTGCSEGNVYVWDIYAILKEAGLEDLLSISNRKATRRPAQLKIPHRMPSGFLDDPRDGVHSHGIHHRSSAHRLLGALSPTVLLGRLSSFFRRSQPIGEAIELQGRQTPSNFFHRGPHVVDVPAVQDKRPLFVAQRSNRDKAKRAQQQQKQTQGQAQASSSHTQHAAASTSAPPAATTTPNAAGANPRLLPLWARVVLFLCCASPPHANGH